MAERIVLERIEAWERDGLIDAATAEVLREAESFEQPASAPSPQPGIGTLVGGFFGPSVSIAEMFAYLGVAFVLGAWYSFAVRFLPEDGFLQRALDAAIPGGLFGLGGVLLARGGSRQRRGAGVAFIVSAAHLGVAMFFLVERAFGGSEPVTALFGAAAFLAVGAWYRTLLPGVLTQALLLAGVTVLAAAILGWLAPILLGPEDGSGPSGALRSRAVGFMLLQAGVWVVTSVVVGVLGLREDQTGGVPATRRAAVTRAWAGLVLVIGLTTALTTTYPANMFFERERILEPVLADLLLFGVAAILLERAFRRDAGAFVVPAGLAVIVALTDLNASYFAPRSSTEAALLVEGLILIAAGLVFDRVRRRVGGPPAASDPEDAVPVEEAPRPLGG